MGNKIARTTQVSASEYYLHDLPSSYNLVLIEVLGSGRFFKSILCKHDEGLVLVKVYFKRGDPLDLKEYERRLSEIREVFHNVQHRHLWPFQFWLETDKAAYLLRQYFFSNLHDRLSTRPFLSLIEKKWLAFQLLCAVKQSHENGVCHGDIKCENVLVTSWNWLYLADFASFKPTYIPDDDPSDFSFFFYTGGRRRCYLAPERFYEHGGELQVQPDAPLKPSMDIFSLGCVIAELFLEGQPLFELSQLLSYRRGQYDPCQFLEKIPDAGIRKMILHMIQLDPEARLSCESYLQEYGTVVFPCYFTPFLHKFFSCLIPVDSDTRVAVTQGAFQEIHRQIMNDRLYEDSIHKTVDFCEQTDSATKQRITALDGPFGDKRDVERGVTVTQFQLIGEISSLLKDVEQRESDKSLPENPASCDTSSTVFTHDVKHPGDLVSNHQLVALPLGNLQKSDYHLKRILKSDLKSLIDRYNSQPDSLLLSFFPGNRYTLRCEGMVLIASLLCSCLRSVKQPQLRRAGLLLLMSSSLYIDDEDLLQHVIPFIILMLSDPAAIVRCAGLEALCNVLPLVQDFPPSDAKIFPEYILPMLSMLPDDPEESVRICYAVNIFKIALTAYRFLICSKNLSDVGVVDKQIKSPPSIEAPERKQIVNMDMELTRLTKSVAEIVHELVMGSKNTPTIRRALLQDIGYLCYFFGKKQSNDFLLPILPAFLNDRDEQLRGDFYGQIVFVCFFVGQRSVEEYLLPYIEQALTDEMEAVIVNALECLTMLCKSRLLGKSILLDMIERAFPLLCYPILWVRQAAVSFIAASSEYLGPVDTNIYLLPVLRPFLHRKPTSLSSDVALLSCLKPPVSKLAFYQVLENARGSDMLERQRKIWYNSSYSNQWETIEHTKKNQPSKVSVSQGNKFVNASIKNTSSSFENTAKSRTMEGTLCNTSTALENRDSLSLEKMRFSGFMSAHISGGNSLFHDRPSEGIPVYSFSMGKHSTVNASANSDASLQWNSLGIGSLSTPLVDPVSKSFVLSNSEHPKLISGSIYNISNASKKVSTSLQDPETHENDQSSYVTSKFQDISVSAALKAGSSIPIEDTIPQSDVSGQASPVRASCVADAGWKPRGVLVAHLQEHRSAVNDIAISNDNSFFVSASDDSTVKIWDTRRLEKDISFRSRLTYHIDGTRALCTTMLNGSALVVVGACDGTVHLFSVDHISRGGGSVFERYSGIADITKKQVGEGAILSLLDCSTGDGSVSRTVLYSTQLCGIHLWDTRADSVAWKFKAAPDEGCISSLVMGTCGNWFVSGTSRGVLTLWDMRFLLPVNRWQYSRSCPIEKMCLFIPPTNSTMSAMGRPLIYVAAGCNEVSLWNAENGSCHQVFRVAGCEGDPEVSSNIPWALTSPSTKSSSKQHVKRNSIPINPKYMTDELNEPPPRLPGIRSLLPLPGGDLLTGGTDLKIRYWDHSSPNHSFAVCGPSTKGVAPENVYDTRSTFGVQVVQETNRKPSAARLSQRALLAVAATDSAGCHCDSVLSLASVKLNQRLLISSSRDGAIKVWK